MPLAKPLHTDGDYFLCHHCGAELPISASFCRHCGASDELGWDDSETPNPSGGYGDDDFDYDEFVAQAFPDAATPRPDARHAFRWIVVVVLCVALLGSTLIFFWH